MKPEHIIALKELNLENDLKLTKKDLDAMKNRPKGCKNISDYIDFLEATGAFETKKPPAKLFDEAFNL